MIQDRGNKKWVSLMLPEHKKLLGKFYRGQSDVSMPDLDEQRLEEINETVQIAIELSRVVTIAYHKNMRYLKVTGVIKSCDEIKRIITLSNRNQSDSVIVIPFAAIIQVQFA